MFTTLDLSWHQDSGHIWLTSPRLKLMLLQLINLHLKKGWKMCYYILYRPKSTSHANTVYWLDLPSVTCSICVVWWWNLWLSAFLQWKQTVRRWTYNEHCGLEPLCHWVGIIYEGVAHTTHQRLPALYRHADLSFIIQLRLTCKKTPCNKANSALLCLWTMGLCLCLTSRETMSPFYCFGWKLYSR